MGIVWWDDYFLFSDPKLEVFRFDVTMQSSCQSYTTVEEIPINQSGCFITTRMNRDLKNRSLYSDNRLASLLSVSSRTAEWLTKYIFQLNKLIHRDYYSYYEKIRSNYTVGIHVRTGNFSSGSRDHRGRLLESVVYQRVEKALETVLRGKERYQIFLATDSEEVQKYMKLTYNKHLILYDEYKIGHSSLHYQIVQSNDYLFRAVVEIDLLSYCDVAIYSRSSFSDVAKFLGHLQNQVYINL